MSEYRMRAESLRTTSYIAWAAATATPMVMRVM